MNATDFQKWIADHGQPIVIDGKPGPATRAAIIAVFTNPTALAVSEGDIERLALRLGCTPKQLRALSTVESGGGAYDSHGRPKILFERHLFHRLTQGAYGVTAYSNPSGGGYNEDSWEKLSQAACKDALAAFGATSWGKFQVLGLHWHALGYPSALELAYSTVGSEAGHYELLCRFLEANHLGPALAKISTNPSDNVALASGYNGSGFRKFKYDEKLAAAMR